MSRNTALAVGLTLTAATALLLIYAAKRVVYFFSFDQASRPATIESAADTAAPPQYGGVTLSWDEVPNARSYNLYWSTQPGITKYNGNRITGITPPFRFTRVEKGRTYYFAVTAVTDAGESSESDEIVYRADP